MGIYDPHNLMGASLVVTGSGVIGSTSGTTIIVTTGEGVKFTVNQNITVCPAGTLPTLHNGTFTGGNAEVMRITGISTDTLTVTRAQEGTTALSNIAIGFQVANTETPKVFTDLELPPANIVHTPQFDSSSAFATANSGGSGSVSQDARRMLLQTGATSGSFYQMWNDWTNAPSGNLWATSSSIACHFVANIDGATFDEFIGVGDITIGAGGITTITNCHYGFRRMQTASGGVILQTTSADGTTEEKNTITDFGTSTDVLLSAVFNKAAGTINFMVNGIIVATHTSKMPFGFLSTSAKPFNFAISNVNTTASSQILSRLFTFTQAA